MTEGFAQLFAEVFRSGGALMYPLALLAAYLYYTGFGEIFRLGGLGKICADNSAFDEAFSRFIKTEFGGSADDRKAAFSRLRLKLVSRSERRIKMMKILSGAAPLIGLLGTVSGITVAIAAAAENSDAVAEGISKALVTTQAGLIVAIPSWILAIAASAKMHALLLTISRREAALSEDAEK